MTLEFDSTVLIKEVQKRTPLYDTSRKEYHYRNLKKKLWNEVCQEVYSSAVWNSMSSQDKTKYGKEVLKRWSSLRHCFRRELAAQKNVLSGCPAKKKKKYLYFDSLSFLLPFTETSNTDGSIKNENIENDLQGKRDISSLVKPKNSNSKTVKKNNDAEIISSLKEGNQMLSNSNTFDSGQDDELFLRSLIPYMKEFSGDQKLLLRMAIIKAILKFKQSLNDNLRCAQINETRMPMSNPIQSLIYSSDSDSSENHEYIPQPSTSQD